MRTPAEILACLETDGILRNLPDGEPLTVDHPQRGELSMCGGCTGSGRVMLPGRRDPVQCPACRGQGIR